MEYDHRPKDNLSGDFVAQCAHCKWEAKYRLDLGPGLVVGDTIYSDPENQAFGRCNRCKRSKMVITVTPEAPAAQHPPGFWTIPKV